MRAEFIFKLQATSSAARKFFHLQSHYLNKICEIQGLNVMIETFEGGSMFFFGTTDDFSRFFSLFGSLTKFNKTPLPKPSLSDVPVDILITKVKVPVQYAFPELVFIVKSAFHAFSSKIAVIQSSDEVATLRFEQGSVLEAWVVFLEEALATIGKMNNKPSLSE